jgi:hypothetical protein
MLSKSTKSIFLLIVFLQILILGNSGFVNAREKLIHFDDTFSKKELHQLKKADRFIHKGEEMLINVDSLAKRKLSSRQLSRELNHKKEQAWLVLRDGYQLKAEVYSNYLSRFVAEDGSRLSVESQGRITTMQSKLRDELLAAKLEFKRARSKGSLAKAVEHQDKGLEKQKNAIEIGYDAIVLTQELLKNRDLVVKAEVQSVPEPVVVDTIPVTEVTKEEVISEAVVATAAVAVVPDQEEKVQAVIEPEVRQPQEKVYFTIQVMADKKRATVAQQKMVYKGTRSVIENKGDGWFRYSVGEFDSYEQASQTMKSEGVKGYVVAYKGQQRISVAEAKKLLGGQ